MAGWTCSTLEAGEKEKVVRPLEANKLHNRLQHTTCHVMEDTSEESCHSGGLEHGVRSVGTGS